VWKRKRRYRPLAGAEHVGLGGSLQRSACVGTTGQGYERQALTLCSARLGTHGVDAGPRESSEKFHLPRACAHGAMITMAFGFDHRGAAGFGPIDHVGEASAFCVVGSQFAQGGGHRSKVPFDRLTRRRASRRRDLRARNPGEQENHRDEGPPQGGAWGHG
jgi:hypothetical protein